ncbi:hypothetical protein PoB_001859000 [Plakobranchus ocellatus]|uniref:Uncharacterized protein n=1 Tax=Plakobranchus ocellatus TaxID=259542 RepID=A0AAV3ZAC3_9GAST|nr:hypothetical protein PoB_001859000 [Plakobranchus ocellatus]
MTDCLERSPYETPLPNKQNQGRRKGVRGQHPCAPPNNIGRKRQNNNQYKRNAILASLGECSPYGESGIHTLPGFRLSSPHQGNLRLSGPPSGRGAGGRARTRDRRVPADLKADSLATVPPTPPKSLLACALTIVR